jgi:hypothetical protein
VIITSSSGDENSQESDEIGGSYFTHYLASALSGARTSITTTSSRSPRPTSTSTTRPCSERPRARAARSIPTYEWDLAGAGDLLLTDLREAKATLTFSGTLEGSLRGVRRDAPAVRGRGRQVRGHDFKLTVIPGNYLVQQRYPTHLEVAEVSLKDGGDERLDADRFIPSSTSAISRRDRSSDRSRRRRRRRLRCTCSPACSARATRRSRRRTCRRFPWAARSVRWQWRDHRFISADFQTGSSQATITFDEYVIPSVVSTTMSVSPGATRRARVVPGGHRASV